MTERARAVDAAKAYSAASGQWLLILDNAGSLDAARKESKPFRTTGHGRDHNPEIGVQYVERSSHNTKLRRVRAVSLAEMLPYIHDLPRADKFRLVQELIADLAQDEGLPDAEYAIWSPYDAHKAAATLLRLIDDDKAQAA